MLALNIESIREYCIGKAEVTESFPFDESTLVFKVLDKMFALIGLERTPLFINLKCDPEQAIELRERHSFVQPGYHMHKKHWNSVYIEDCDSAALLQEWIDDSYDLIVKSLPKKKQQIILDQL